MLKPEHRYGWDEEDQYYEYDPEEASQWELEGWVQDQRGEWVQDPELREYYQAVWSTLIGRGSTRLGSHWSRWFIVLLRQCLLCHKEPAPRIQSPLLGALERKKPPTRGFLRAPRWFFMA